MVWALSRADVALLQRTDSIRLAAHQFDGFGKVCITASQSCVVVDRGAEPLYRARVNFVSFEVISKNDG